LGLAKAGFDILLASDVEKSAERTFLLNRPSIPFLRSDVRRLERRQIMELVAGRRVHLVAGGPPCQGFTTIGDQIAGDPRNTLFDAFLRIVRWTAADAFLMENVSYLRSQYEGRFEEEIVNAFSREGYQVFVETLNAADYGVPQIRQRVMFFGTKIKRLFHFPVATHAERGLNGLRPWRTVGDSIMDLVCAWDAPNHDPLRHSDRVIQRYRLRPGSTKPRFCHNVSVIGHPALGSLRPVPQSTAGFGVGRRPHDGEQSRATNC